MRKMILFFVLVILCFLGYSEGNRVMTVSIKLILSPLYGGGEIEIYNDSYSRIAEVMDKIKNARTVNKKFIIKEALTEGSYYIIVKKNGVVTGSYEVFNSQNIYDLLNDKYLKCAVLSDIYQIFVGYFLEDRIK